MALSISGNSYALKEFKKLLNKHGEETYELWDDCMSLPGVLIEVRRHRRISVDYQDLDFEPRSLRPGQDVSELLQHEIDHLDGILFTRRMTAIGAVRAAAHRP